ncbi:helix-turn-helix domain-containing protein [Streptacidiphilus fuscans]|uniref:helix-turn-helix domain-containing protein n=1 Tax=Streptacidiphilus fuscans TaxID=2789292 RepID=UPI001C06E92A|nr:helix-turn-helix transcriptional regulator [Streptacidiphilus fuscans]
MTGIVAGFVLRLCRESAGHTQARIAEVLGVDLATVQGWESGRRPLANMKAGALLELRRRLPALGADAALVGMLDAAMDADRIIGAALGPPQDAARHPLAGWVHDRAVAHMIGWAAQGTPPPQIAARPRPPRRGAAPKTPLLPAADRQQFFEHLRQAAEEAHRAGQAAPLLRRQALYLTSYDRRPEARAWTTHALHQGRRVLGLRGWSDRWAEARSTATALARQGDPQPLVDFIDRALCDDDQGEAANLNYWAHWLGAGRGQHADDRFMADRDLTGWEPVALFRLLVQGVDEAPTYVELYAHTLWALLRLHPWLPLAVPGTAGLLTSQAEKLLDGAGPVLSSRARREITAVHQHSALRST